MLALTKVLAGTGAIAAMVAAAPAAAQYYPYGYGSVPSMGNAPAYGYGYGGYSGTQGPMVGQCTAAVQARLRDMNGYGGYGYSNYNGGGRVLGVSRVDPRDDGGFTVRGVAASGAYGYGQQPDLIFRCRTDFRGYVTDVSIQPAQRNYNSYGYAQPYQQTPYDPGTYYQDYGNVGPYGYSRY